VWRTFDRDDLKTINVEDALRLLLLMFPRYLHASSTSHTFNQGTWINVCTTFTSNFHLWISPLFYLFITLHSIYTQHLCMCWDKHTLRIHFVWPLSCFAFQSHHSILQPIIIQKQKKLWNIFLLFLSTPISMGGHAEKLLLLQYYCVILLL